jgi:hypothetical protein
MTRGGMRSFGGVAAGIAVVIAAVLVLAVDVRPRVAGLPPADAASAVQARDLMLELQAVVANGAGGRGWRVDEAALNGALAAGARVVPGLAAQAEVGPGDVRLAASWPIAGTGLWLNLRAALAASEHGLEVARVRVGRLPLPPGLVLPALRAGGDRLLGDGLATVALASVASVRTEPPAVTVALDLSEADRRRIGDRLRAALSARAGAADRHRIHVHLWHLGRAIEEGGLPRRGSALPYLRFALERAHRLAPRAEAGDDAAELRAALFALTLLCGDEMFAAVVGVDLPDSLRGDGNACADTRLGGRVDLRQHFVVSAGLKAATSATAALGIGELKELLDSSEGGTGFSFDDMAANLAGARFAETALATPRSGWPGLIARMADEAAVMPSIEGLPAGLSEEAFRARFGDVESEPYRAMLARIEERVAALPLHAPAGMN